MPDPTFLQAWKGDLKYLASRYADRTAITDARGTITYKQLVQRAATLAAQLVRMNVGPGDCVATLVDNSAAAVHTSWAIAITGACETTLNPAQSLDEQTWSADLTSARLLVHDGAARRLPPVNGETISCDSPSPSPADSNLPVCDAKSLTSKADWARVLFTSGTTGRPKGVVHSHRGRWVAAQLLRQSLAESSLAGGSTLLLTPFSHGSSLLAYALLPAGKPVHLLPGFDPDMVRRLVANADVAHIFAPPAVLMRLVELFRGKRIHTVRTLLTGTAPLSRELYEEARSIFGPVVRVTYGMTEIFNPITVLEPDATDSVYESLGEDAVGMVGWPAPGVQISIRNEAGEEVPAGVQGQIHVRATHMYSGYLRERDYFEAAAEFHPTGDIAYLDPSRGFRLLGRMHDVIKTGGYKVVPQEVEAALRKRGIGGDFAVLGLPSQRWGEIVLFARSQDAEGSFEDVREAAASLTQYKRPRLFAALPALSRNAIGKVDRRRILEEIAARWELLDGAHPQLKKRLP